MAENEEKPDVEQAKKLWEQALESYLELMRRFEPLSEEVLSNKEDPFMAMKYKLSPALFHQCVIHSSDICDKNNMFRKGIEVLETAFKQNNDTLKNSRYVEKTLF